MPAETWYLETEDGIVFRGISRQMMRTAAIHSVIH